MGKKVNPRHGSMQFWPRVRASRSYARIRSLPTVSEAKPLAFAGYKVGMAHVMATDTSKHTQTKGEQISLPVTVIECPPVKIASVRCYKKHGYGTKVAQELHFKTSKEFSRKASPSSKVASASDLEKLDTSDITHITMQVYTQPQLTTIGKKKPEIFEVPIGGSVDDQVSFVKEHIGKDISLQDVFAQNQYVDVRAVTIGKGYQGPVKRFGIGLRAKKSEKVVRGPGSLGSWKGQGHMMYRIAYAGQMGYHQRTQYSNFIVGIFDEPDKVNPQGGFINYGNVKNTYLLVKGSVPGPKKRLITMTAPLRPVKKQRSYDITFVSTSSQQGN